MALPNLNPNQQSAQGQQAQYVPASFSESIKTNILAGFSQLGSNFIRSSRVLRTLGGGAVAETLDLKRRERYERSGRDEQGRKLTKQEFEEREKRRKDLGALSQILEIVQLWNDTGVPAILAKDNDGWFLLERMEIHLTDIKTALAGGMGVFSVGGGYASNQGAGASGILDADGNPASLTLADVPTANDAAELSRQEAMDEKEREDDQDQLESEERQQGFFSKLFGGLRNKDEKKDSGLFGSLLSALSGLGSLVSGLFAKYIGGMLGGAITRLLGGAGSLLGSGAAGAGRMLGGAARGIGAAVAGSAAGKTIAQAGGEIAKGARATGGAISRAGSAIAGYAGKAVDSAKGIGSDLLKTRSRLPSQPGFLSRAFGAVKDTAAKLNPTKYLKDFITKNSGKILKGLTSMPGLAAAITSVVGALNIRDIVNDVSLSKEEKKEAIGKALGSVLGGAIGSIGGGVLGSFLPIPGLGTIIGTFGGGWAGEKIGEALSEAIGPKAVYDFVESVPGIGNLISVGDEENPQESIDGENEIRQQQGLPELTPEEIAQRNMVSDITTRAEPGSLAPTSADMAPPTPVGAETGSQTAINDIMKSMPTETVAQVSMPTANIQQTNNAVMATGLSARLATGIDMSPAFQGARPAFAF